METLDLGVSSRVDLREYSRVTSSNDLISLPRLTCNYECELHFQYCQARSTPLIDFRRKRGTFRLRDSTCR